MTWKNSTVSMLTTRLSSVITGCPRNATTCSRRSMSGLTRSTMGTMKFIPGSSVLRYRPNRSTLRARACGTIRTVLLTTMNTRMTAMAAAISPASSMATPGDGPVAVAPSIAKTFNGGADRDDL